MIEPVILEGKHVRLEPLSMDHLEGLSRDGLEESLWELIPYPVRSMSDMAKYISAALDGQRQGTMLPFATIAKEVEEPIGSTRYGNIDLKNKRLEIGWTWITPKWQRTALNTEAKLLMLSHAFEVLGCNRVELKTDALNSRSRKAILRLGATEEGVFRKHVVTASGRIRDTVYYSITDDDWPSVKARLSETLARFA